MAKFLFVYDKDGDALYINLDNIDIIVDAGNCEIFIGGRTVRLEYESFKKIFDEIEFVEEEEEE